MYTRVSRREVLKASGVAVSLPFLGAMSRASNAEESGTPKRMVLICSTLGFYSPSLFPKTTGRDYEATEYLELLQGNRGAFSLISGLSHPEQTGKEPHDTEMTFLSSARNPGLGGFRNSISVDQVAAEHIGNQTRFSSVALNTIGSESQAYNSNGVMIPAEHIYGPYDESLIQSVPLEALGSEAKSFKLGDMLEIQAHNGQQIFVKVTQIDEQNITLDANHQFVGKNLTFDVEIVNVRNATTEELLTGHVFEEPSCCESNSCSLK